MCISWKTLKIENNEYNNVFGSVEISENEAAADVSSVNGDLSLANGASAKDVNAVNGNVEIGNNVSVYDLTTVNGDIRGQSQFVAKGDVTTVNGNITLSENSQISGDLASVNGDLYLTQTSVGNDIQNIHGNITLIQNSVVEGDIEFNVPNNSSWWNNKKTEREHTPPTLTIDASSNVKGRIILKQLVVLEIEDPALLAKVDLLTPNETEAEILTGIPVVDKASADKGAECLLSMGVSQVILTLGKKGIFYKDKTTSKDYPCFKVDAIDTTAAGDTFNGAIAAALASQQPIEEALNFSQAASALSVTKIGAQSAIPRLVEIKAFLG